MTLPRRCSTFERIFSHNRAAFAPLRFDTESVTAGFGARKGYSYFDRLTANPPDEFEALRGICLGAVIPRLQFTNLAVSGSTSRELVERQLPLLAPAGSNVVGMVVITTGGNDLIHNYGRTPPRDQAMYGATWSGNM